MTMMRRLLLIVPAVVAVVATGVVHGFWTGRWQLSAAPAEAASRLATVPLEAGDWLGQDLETDPRLLTDAYGVLYRRYVHRKTGKAVTLYLLCGRPGPLSVHTPDVCYGGSGFTVTRLGRQSCGTGPDAAGRFEAAQMAKRRLSENVLLRVFWSWSADGPWVLPDNPRVTFAQHPVLYKMYLIRELAQANEPVEDDPSLDLMRQLQPELRRSLFPGT
jgi:hypothetical protein